LLIVTETGLHPIRFFADEERDRRNAGWHNSPPAFAGIFQRRRMRRQPAPADRAGQAKLIQHSRIVLVHAPRQNLLLPGIGRNFETLQLTQCL
jgi:hypothetical protein